MVKAVTGQKIVKMYQPAHLIQAVQIVGAHLTAMAVIVAAVAAEVVVVIKALLAIIQKYLTSQHDDK